MTINAQITKVMVIFKKEEDGQNNFNIRANGMQLEVVKEYKYIGQWIINDNRCIG